MLLLILIVLGSIFTGLATVTESAAIGAFGSFLIVVFRKKLTWKGFWEVLEDTGRTTAMLTFLIACVSLFSRFLSMSGFTRSLANSVVDTVNIPTWAIMVAIYVVFVIAGCLMDGTSMLLIFTPILLPIVTKLGFDPVWWGVITVAMIEIGFLTPPVGLCVYVLRGVSGASLEEIFNSIYPFLAVWLVCVALFTLYPEIVLFLPKLMFAK
jgi:tripartite ATP-independent transporter DctM subunit